MDDDDGPSRQNLTRQSNSGVTYSSGVYRDPLLYSTALDRNPELYSKRNSPQTSQSNSGVTNSTVPCRYPLLYRTALDRDPEVYSKRISPETSQSKSSYSTGVYRDPELYSKRNSPQTSQSNSEVTSSSFKPQNDSYPSRNKSTHDLNRVISSATVQLARDEAAESRAGSAVSGKDTFKLPSIPKSLASVNLIQAPVSSSSFQPIKPPPISTKPTIAVACSSSSIPQSKDEYVWVEQASTTYVFPKEIKCLIEKDIVPGVLKMPLSKSSYKDYFHALLYAEDCYLEVFLSMTPSFLKFF